MKTRENYNDIYLFMTVAETGSFTQAAGRLDMAQSNISRAVSGLEERLGVQLLVRTTRKIALTQAGENLFAHAQQAFSQLDKSLMNIVDLRQTPSGVVRISASQHSIDTLLLPRLVGFSETYPDIRLELISDNRFVDIISEHFDAGLRLGGEIAEGMVAVKLTDEMQMVVVGSPDYFRQYGIPQTPQDLVHHSCTAYQFQSGSVYHWELQDENGNIYRHKPQGRYVFADSYMEAKAARMGLGLSYVPLNLVQDDLQHQRLIRVLHTYAKPLPAWYIYYPHRNITPAFRAFLAWLKQ